MSKIKFSRRNFLKMSSIACASGAGLLGCSQDHESQDQLMKNLHMYATGTLNVPAEVWNILKYEKNINTVFKDNGNTPGSVISQMISGTAASDFEIGGLLGGAEKKLAKAGAILPWDLEKIPNMQGLWPWAQNIEHTRHDDQQYGLPLVVNADSMIYLPEKIKSVQGYESGIIDSYAAIFDPALKGRTSMEDSWVNSVIFTAIYLKGNDLVSINEPGNLTETELKEVMTFLIEKKKEGQFLKFWSGWEQGVEVMRSGEVWAMTGWEPIVKALNTQGISAKYAVPKEGYEGWSIDLLLHKGAQEKDLIEECHEFANWLYEGLYGATLLNDRGYAVPHVSTSEYLLQESEAFTVTPKALEAVKNKLDGKIYWQNIQPDNVKLYEEWWSKLRSA